MFEEDSTIMTAPQLSEETVAESFSVEILSYKKKGVNGVREKTVSGIYTKRI